MTRPTITYHCSRDDDDQSFYLAEQKDDEHIKIRHHPRIGDWTPDTMGKTAAKLEDTGFAVKIKVKGKKPFELDYTEVEAVMLLLTYFDQEDPQFPTKVIPLVEKP